MNMILEAEEAVIRAVKADGLFEFGLSDVAHIPHAAIALGTLKKRHVIKVTDGTVGQSKAVRLYSFVPIQYGLFT